jgi:hypothetical protein
MPGFRVRDKLSGWWDLDQREGFIASDPGNLFTTRHEDGRPAVLARFDAD